MSYSSKLLLLREVVSEHEFLNTRQRLLHAVLIINDNNIHKLLHPNIARLLLH